MPRVDRVSMNGSMRGALKQLTGGLYSDVRAAAENQGLGQDYDDAMRMYKQASLIKGKGKYVLGAAAGAVGVDKAYEGIKRLIR